MSARQSPRPLIDGYQSSTELTNQTAPPMFTKRRVSETPGFSIFSLDKKNKKLLPKRARSCVQCQQRKVKCERSDDDAGACNFCVTKGDSCSLITPKTETPTAVPNGQLPAHQTPHAVSPLQVPSQPQPHTVQNAPQPTSSLDHINKVDWIKFMDEEISNNDFTFEFLSINHSPGLALATEWDSEPTTSTLPIDRRTKDGSFMHYGASGEYDPWLRFHYYQYDTNNECFFTNKFFRRLGTPYDPVIFAFKDRTRLIKEAKELIPVVALDPGMFARLAKFIPNFIVLYLKFIFPSLPILDGNLLNETFSNETQEYDRNKEHIDVLLLLLIAKSVRRWDTYDTSIDMFADDDELVLNNRKDLLTHCWEMIVDQLHAPDLSTLKSLILFYHLLGFKKDSQANGFEKSVLASMMSTCYSLGLHLDCTGWEIPKYEKNLRVRLWWTVYLLEKWGSFVAGSPSMINDDEYSVKVPKDFDSLFDDVGDYLNSEKGYITSFEMSLKLTFLLNDVWSGLFSTKALSTSTDEVLRTCDEFETKLKSWQTKFREIQTPGNTSTNSLLLSCYTLNITLFRARFRILEPSQYQEIFFDKAKHLLGEIVTFLIQLPVTAIHGFWYRWSRSLFMYLKDFVLSLIVMSKTKQQSLDVLNLARQFREWLELNSRGLEILWTTLLRLNIATQSIGTQFKRHLKDRMSNE